MQKFIAEESFWKLFPEAAIGVIVARGMKPASEVPAEDAAAIAALLREANAQADRHLTSNTISQNEVVRVWRDAYQQFKTKKGARCSIENLLKRVLKGNPVGSITPAVDIYNAVSLKYALPVGGEDIDTFEGDLRLGITEEATPSARSGRTRTIPRCPTSCATATTRGRCAAAGTGATANAPRSPTIRRTRFSSSSASIRRASTTCARRSMSSPSS